MHVLSASFFRLVVYEWIICVFIYQSELFLSLLMWRYVLENAMFEFQMILPIYMYNVYKMVRKKKICIDQDSR